MWQVLPHLARQAGNAIRAAGGGKKGFDKVRKAHPSWFKSTGKRKTTKLDNRTGKPVSGPGAKGSKAKRDDSYGPTDSEIHKMALNAPKKGKYSPAQMEKFRDMFRNRNKTNAWRNLSPAIKADLKKLKKP
ncbi:uncharacterized protein METZ01_LOCUS57148 [marine metagenome]|uniref:Uncharacterized protein n=1 Tax=marine metagenome TaxID=408172 RepID=A0A381SLJ4_9ZZZZ